MKHRTRSRFRLLALVLLACSALGLVACTGGDSAGSGKDRTGESAGTRAAGSSARQFNDSQLPNMLLPRAAVPLGLAPTAQSLLPNEYVAEFFPDQEAAKRAMAQTGRMQGATADYRLPSAPRASERAVAVSSSVSWYKSVAGAQGVIKDPTMELVIHRFGLTVGEIEMEKVAQESRVFRGFRDGDGPDLAAYLVLFRKENIVGVVVVVVPNGTDDSGKLALNLAQRQASLPFPSGSATQR